MLRGRGTEDRQLADVAVNGLHMFPPGPASWRALTLEGDARPEWRHIPIRRLALFLEASLEQGTPWAAFEPDGVALWERLRAAAGEFLLDLFRRGAFQGQKPEEAFFVNCDRTTMTEDDIDAGEVNLSVGFAPFRPGEFVVINVRRMAAAGADRPAGGTAGPPSGAN